MLVEFLTLYIYLGGCGTLYEVMFILRNNEFISLYNINSEIGTFNVDYGNIIGGSLKFWSSVLSFYNYVLMFLYLGIRNIDHIFLFNNEQFIVVPVYELEG